MRKLQNSTGEFRREGRSSIVPPSRATRRASAAGFSLIELVVVLGILLSVSGIVMSLLSQMTKTEGTVANRTEMHSGVRSATEVLQQEISQAGRVTLPAAVTLTSAVTAAGASSPNVSSTTGMFVNEQLVVDTGPSQETVTLTAVGSSTITAAFANSHSSGAPITVAGAFSSGIVPPSAAPSSFPNGSDGNVLKLYGDINGDGNMVYVEYTCDTVGGNLYRNEMPFTQATKTTLTSAQILLPNILPNPNDLSNNPVPCFNYQVQAVGATYYVVNVAVTLTFQTQNPDPQTGQFQTESKALLYVSPRNVFEGWEMASMGLTDRIQPMPASVTGLLPCVETAKPC